MQTGHLFHSTETRETCPNTDHKLQVACGTNASENTEKDKVRS